MKSRKNNFISKIPFLIAGILAVGVIAAGCISGVTPIGWSGGVVADNTLYVGSSEGRLVAMNLADDSRRWSERLKAPAQGGLFGCAPAMGGCGQGTSNVAIYGTPVVSGDLVYIAGYNGKIYAYNAGTLAARWVYPREGYLRPFVGGLVTDGKKLYLGCTDGRVYALDAATGDKLWEFATGGKIWATPVYYSVTVFDGSLNKTTVTEMLFIGSFDNKLYALNTRDGTRSWEFPTNGAIMSTPLIFDDNVYFGSLDRNLYAVKASDGAERWRIRGENWFWARPAVWNGNIYAGCLDGKVYVVRADTGASVATLDLKNPIASSPVVAEGSVVFATRKGAIYSVNTISNQASLLADLKQEIDGPLAVNAGIIYIHTRDIALQRINVASGAVLPPLSLKGP